MSRTFHTLCAGLLLAVSATAQLELLRNMNPGPGRRYSSRGTVVGSAAGWVCQRYPALGVSRIQALRAVVQDQDCATRSMTRMMLLAESAVAGTPDEGNASFDSGSFLMPAGVGTCAWSFTLWSPVPIAPPTTPTGHALFTAVLVDPAPLWAADGTSSWITLVGAPWSEFPNVRVFADHYPPSSPGTWPGAEYGASFESGSGGGNATRYAGTWRIYSDNTIFMRAVQGGVEYDLRVGASESPQSAGLYGSVVTAGPDNFGMAGRFPDVADHSRTTPPREDDFVFQTTSGSMIGAGLESIFVDPLPLRRRGVPAVDLPGVGRLELSTLTAQVVVLAQPIAARTSVHRLALDGLGWRGPLRAATHPVHLTFQAVRVDFGTGRVELSRAGELSILP